MLQPRRPWKGRRVVLGVTGGIAAYKSVQLARDLTQLGAHVDVVLTTAARAFVGALSFEGVTGRPVYGDILAEGSALIHIRLAREADVVCVAPATADFIARAAHGRADDLISALLLATRAPVLICPAMNDRMFAHPQTTRNVAHIRENLGYSIVGPAIGPLAFDEGEGPGRLEDPDAIVDAIGAALTEQSLAGRRLVVSAGPTREAIDPVRFISNRSSGKMGYAIARAARRAGAEVVLISGPTALQPPPGVSFVPVETAEQMLTAVREQIGSADALIMAAAVADFRPGKIAGGKIKKRDAPDAIALEAAPDVLASTIQFRGPGLVTVGFALETDDLRRNAQAKLQAKQLDLIVLNDARNPEAGFEVDTNEVTLIDAGGNEEVVSVRTKDEIADIITGRVAQLIAARA